MKKPVRILQIMPADGWFARVKDGSHFFVSDAVACFALIEDPNESENSALRCRVEPMWSIETGIDLCSDTANFVDIVKISDARAVELGWDPLWHQAPGI